MIRYPIERILAAAAAAVVILAIAGGLVVTGSPAKQRLRRIDERRVQDLDGISRAVDRYFERNKKLPGSIDEACKTCHINFKDPVTKQPYIYEKTGEKAYRLCAGFALDNDSEEKLGRYYYAQIRWKHKAGNYCYDLTAPAYSNDR